MRRNTRNLNQCQNPPNLRRNPTWSRNPPNLKQSPNSKPPRELNPQTMEQRLPNLTPRLHPKLIHWLNSWLKWNPEQFLLKLLLLLLQSLIEKLQSQRLEPDPLQLWPELLVSWKLCKVIKKKSLTISELKVVHLMIYFFTTVESKNNELIVIFFFLFNSEMLFCNKANFLKWALNKILYDIS